VRPRKVKVEGNFGIEICSIRRDGIEESWFYRGVWSGVYGRIYLGKTNRKGSGDRGVFAGLLLEIAPWAAMPAP
jgi:hypothetical protein